jgi:hypothetical protein
LTGVGSKGEALVILVTLLTQSNSPKGVPAVATAKDSRHRSGERDFVPLFVNMFAQWGS